MERLRNGFWTILALCFVGFVLFRIVFNVVENLRLITGGTVTQGIILSTGICHLKSHNPDYPVVVQFTDTQGRQQEASVLACGSIGLPFRQGGDHVSIVYLPGAPPIARIQSDLVLQFWVLEAPLLLIVLLIVLMTLRGLRLQARKTDDSRPIPKA